MSASLRSVDGQDEATILREIQSALRDLRFGANGPWMSDCGRLVHKLYQEGLWKTTKSVRIIIAEGKATTYHIEYLSGETASY